MGSPWKQFHTINMVRYFVSEWALFYSHKIYFKRSGQIWINSSAEGHEIDLFVEERYNISRISATFINARLFYETYDDVFMTSSLAFI